MVRQVVLRIFQIFCILIDFTNFYGSGIEVPSIFQKKKKTIKISAKGYFGKI